MKRGRSESIYSDFNKESSRAGGGRKPAAAGPAGGRLSRGCPGAVPGQGLAGRPALLTGVEALYDGRRVDEVPAAEHAHQMGV